MTPDPITSVFSQYILAATSGTIYTLWPNWSKGIYEISQAEKVTLKTLNIDVNMGQLAGASEIQGTLELYIRPELVKGGATADTMNVFYAAELYASDPGAGAGFTTFTAHHTQTIHPNMVIPKGCYLGVKKTIDTGNWFSGYISGVVEYLPPVDFDYADIGIAVPSSAPSRGLWDMIKIPGLWHDKN